MTKKKRDGKSGDDFFFEFREDTRHAPHVYYPCFFITFFISCFSRCLFLPVNVCSQPHVFPRHIFSFFFSAHFVSEERPISEPRSGVTARPGKNGAMTHRLGCGRVTFCAGRAPSCVGG